jgi:hypothetical protein
VIQFLLRFFQFIRLRTGEGGQVRPGQKLILVGDQRPAQL